jgi:hypothetical protein
VKIHHTPIGDNNMPPVAMRVIRTYAQEVVRLRKALAALNDWCPSYAPNQAEIDALLAPGRCAPVTEDKT